MLRLSPKVGAMDAWTPTHNLEFAQHLMMTIKSRKSPYQQFSLYDECELHRATSIHVVHKITDVAIDMRPRTPMLVKKMNFIIPL